MMYEYRATLRRIVDGDTVDVDIDCGFDIVLSNQRIRLYGIDTPESRTRDLEEKKFGKLASKFLEDNLPTTFTLRTRLDGKGKYGRILGELVCYYPEYDREISLRSMLDSFIESLIQKLGINISDRKDSAELRRSPSRRPVREGSKHWWSPIGVHTIAVARFCKRE
jgi:hypothetical protein